jgi:hypothetical protein
VSGTVLDLCCSKLFTLTDALRYHLPHIRSFPFADEPSTVFEDVHLVAWIAKHGHCMLEIVVCVLTLIERSLRIQLLFLDSPLLFLDSPLLFLDSP